MDLAADFLRSTDHIWNELIRIGDELVSSNDVLDQAVILKEKIAIITGGMVNIFLSEDFHSMPHSSQKPKDFHSFPINFIKKSSLQEVEFLENPGTYQKINIPLTNLSCLIGYICVEFFDKQKIGDQDILLLQNVGIYLGQILDLTRQTKVKDWRLDQIELVRAVSSSIVQIRDTKKLFPRIVELIQSTFNLLFVVLYTADNENFKLIYRSSAGKDLLKMQLEELTQGNGISFGEGLVGTCALNAERILSQDVLQDNRYRLVSGLEDTRSELCLPLLVEEKLVGVLELLSDQRNRFHENDVMVLESLADYAALAIHNAVLFDDLLEQAWATTLMLQISDAAKRTDSVENLLEEAVRTITLLTGVEKCAIYLKNASRQEYILQANYGFDQGEKGKLAMLPFTNPGMAAFDEALLTENPQSIDGELLGWEDENKGKAPCCHVIPISTRGKDYGIMLVDHVGKEGSSEEGVSLLDALVSTSKQVAVAIENVRLAESRENEAYINTVLLQAAEMVAASSELNFTLENILHLLPLVVGVDTSFVYELSKNRQRLILRSKTSLEWKRSLKKLPNSINLKNRSIFSRIIESESPVFFRLNGDPVQKWVSLKEEDIIAEENHLTFNEPMLIIFPLFSREDRFGILVVQESEHNFEYRVKKVEILSGISSHISMAFQNEKLKNEMIESERLKKELQLAHEIQRTFLPKKIPIITGWNISAKWLPAKQVGGDFYDAFYLADNKLGILVADVSDKGLPAALYMTVARTLLHAEAIEGWDPDETLGRVNRILLNNSREGLFVTCVYAVVDLITGQINYANAGHNQPLCLRKGSKYVEWLRKGGMPLGVSETLQLKNESFILQPGDIMLMYTDGVTEMRNPEGDFFGEERLVNNLYSYISKPYTDLIQYLEEKFFDFQKSAVQADDLTLISLERKD